MGISKELRKEIEDSITKSKIALVMRFPFFGSIATKLQFFIDEEFYTFYTDGRKLGISAKMYDEMKKMDKDNYQSWFNFIICHEILHNVYEHFRKSRIGNRDMLVEDESGNLLRLFNIAADYIINQGIVTDVAALAALDAGLTDKAIKMPPFGLIDSKYDEKWTTEMVYDELAQTRVKYNKGGKSKKGNSGKGDDSGSINLDGKKTLDDHEKSESNAGKDNGKDTEVGESDQEFWKEAAEQGIIIQKMRGTLPGGIQRLADLIFEPPKIPWTAELAQYVTCVNGTNERLLPPNKRHRRIMLPSFYSEEIEFVFVMDTSGSMDLEELKKGANELEAIFYSFENCKVRVISCDAAVHSNELWEGFNSLSEDVEKLGKMFKGGGGTDFRPVFNAVAEENTTVMIFFTDGYGTFPDQAPDYDVIWVRKEGQLEPDKFPFGRVITINN